MLQPNKKYKKSQYNFTGCVTGLCKDLAEENKTNESSFRKKNNLYGDAWSMQPYGDKIDISKGYSNLKIGDVINLSRAVLPGDAKKNIPSANQHVGRVSKIVDGVPYIKHYVASGADRKYYEEPINNISQFKEYKPTAALRLDSYKNIKPNKPNLKFDKNYTPNNIELDMLKGDKDRASLQKKLSLTNEEYDRLSKMSYGVMGAETDNGRSMRSLYRMAVPDFIQKGIKVAGDVLKNRDTYDENINNLSQGYGSIKESSLHGISDNNPNYTKRTGLTANQRIRKGDYKDLERTNNYLHGAMSSIGVNPDNMENGANSYKGTLANLAFLKKRFPNASDTELLKRYTGKSDITEYKKKYDSYINNIDGKSNNNKQYDWKEDVIGTLSDAANKYYDTTKNIKDAVVSTARDYIPGPLAIKAMLGDALGGKAPITNKTLSAAENKAMEKVANRVVKNKKNNTDYQSYFPNLNAKEASAVSGGNTNKSFNTIFNMLTPQGQLQNTLGQSSVKQKGKNVIVSDTYDFNDQGKSFGILDDIQKRGLSPYNVARAIGRNVGSMDGQGAPVKLVYKNTNRRADGGYMNNGINPKFNDYLNVTQYALGGYTNPGDPSKFILGPNTNPMIIPSQGSYPLSYRDRGDRDADGVLFTQSKQVSRVDANGKPLTRNQIAENQKMWNMQKEAYGPQQQAFNVWKNNEENTMRGGYNPQEYYNMVAKFNSQPDVQLDGLMINEANKRGASKGSCSTGQSNRGESLRDNRAYGGWLDKYDDSNQYAEGGKLDTSTKSWQDQQLAMKAERDQKLKNLLINRPQFKKTTLNDQVAEKLRQDRIVTTAKDATAVRNYNNADKHSNIARNKTDKEIIAERNANIAKANNAKLNQWSTDIINPATWTRQNVADAAAGLGDKARLFPNDAHSFVDEYLNPGVMIGNMGKSLGEAPLQAKQSNSYLPYLTAIGAPLVAGAIGGIGAKSTGQFVNNMVNPLAGLEYNPKLFTKLNSELDNMTLNKINNYMSKRTPSQSLKRELEPYVSRVGEPNISREEEVFRNVMGPEYRGAKELENTKFFDQQGNLIQNPELNSNSQISENIFGGTSLSDKEKQMYKWFENQSRFDKLPKTENKKSLSVLEDFKTRIETPEGKRRLKELGISDSEAKELHNIKIVEDPNTFGYYLGEKNAIAMNPNHPLPRKVVRHEIEHGVQAANTSSRVRKLSNDLENFKYLFRPKKAAAAKYEALKPTSEIDDMLSGLELRKEGTPGKTWSNSADDKPINISEYKPKILDKQNATDYFLTGSSGKEKSAFLSEVQQYMMDKGSIPKTSYVEITPQMVKETFMDAMFDEAGGGKYLRIFNIMKPTQKNYELIAKSLNKMLTVAPYVVPTAIGINSLKQNREGGYLNQKQSSTNSWLNKYE
jgi:hypothetical protein